MKIAAILPAYNEAARVRDVLRTVKKSISIDEIIVVNDGSTDDTAGVVSSISGVRLINLSINQGKGGAMMAGVAATNADILLFLDADLIGLKPDHVENLVAPVKLGKVKMSVGMFRGGRKLTDWSQKLVPNISGQRTIRREIFEQIPDLGRSRYGVEMAITRFCHHYRVPTEIVLLSGVTHPMKEEKLGFVKGCISRTRMYYEIIKIMMNPRAPKRVHRTRTTLPRILRRFAANDRRNGNSEGAYLWLYKKERTWRRRKSGRRKWE